MFYMPVFQVVNLDYILKGKNELNHYFGEQFKHWQDLKLHIINKVK